MLSNVSISVWTARKFDKGLSENTDTSTGAEEGTCRVTKGLCPKDKIEPVNKAAARVRKEHYKYTLPWMDDGPRILPSEVYFDYTRAIQKERLKFEQAVDSFCNLYPLLKAEAPVRMQGSYRLEDWPVDIHSKFRCKPTLLPIPDHQSDDWRVSLPDEEMKDLRDQFRQEGQEVLAAAQQEVWRRMLTVVKSYAETMSDKDKVFRDTKIENIRAVCEIAPRLNVLGDPELDRLVDGINQELVNVSPQALRDSSSIRNDKANKAEQIMKDIEAKMAGAF
jgi:hypothetical protein